MIVERILAHRTPVELQVEPTSFSADSNPETHSKPDATPLISALLVEVGGVIYDDTCWWRWLAQMLTHTGIHTRYEALLENWETEFLQHTEHGCDDFWKALRHCLTQLGLTTGCCDEVQAAASALRKQWEASLHPFPGVSQTLSKLSQRGVPLVALAEAGCSCGWLARRLRSLSVASYFDRVLCAEDGGRSLVNPAFYSQLLADLRFQPNEVAVVSNKAWHLAAAAQAGLATVAMNCPGNVHADLDIDRIASLLTHLRYRGGHALAA